MNIMGSRSDIVLLLFGSALLSTVSFQHPDVEHQLLSGGDTQLGVDIPIV